MSGMETRLTIGDFSRMTYLSVKALRHYHEIGLLEPAVIDADTGYRLYQPAQLGRAQVIRRLRDLGMPLDGIRDVITAPDLERRNAAIVSHLRRMERELDHTQSVVASLRALLDQPAPTPLPVEYRTDPALRVLAVRDRIGMDDAETWSSEAFAELHRALDEFGSQRTGPDGALWHSEFFQADAGEVVAFVPIAANEPAPRSGRAALVDLPASEVAVTVHAGPFADLDRAYASLGTYVAERAIGFDGPIRENYLITAADTPDESAHRTEVCWPVFQTTTGRGDRR